MSCGNTFQMKLFTLYYIGTSGTYSHYITSHRYIHAEAIHITSVHPEAIHITWVHPETIHITSLHPEAIHIT